MADIEKVKEFYNNFRSYERSNLIIINELKHCRDMLLQTQKDPVKNFFSTDTEGSSEYRAMTGSLQKLIKTLENKSSSELEIKQGFKDLYTSSYNYHEKKKRFKSVTTNKSGYFRFRTSAKLAKLVPLMIIMHDNGRLLFKNETDKKTGISYSNETLNDIEKRAKHLVTKHADDLEDEGDWKLQPNNDDLIKVANEQLKFTNKIKKISKTMHSKYDRDKDIDSYLRLKRNMSMSDKAKYFLLKKKMDQMFAPGITRFEARSINEGFNSDIFKKEYTELSKNPHFINCIKKHPVHGFSKWVEFEAKTDTLIQELQEESMGLGLKRYPTGIVGHNIDGRGAFGDASEEKKNERYNQIYTDFAKALTLDILINPKNRKLAQDVAANPDNKKLLNDTILKYLKDKNPIKNKTVVKGVQALDALTGDQKSIKEIIDNYTKTAAAIKKETQQHKNMKK